MKIHDILLHVTQDKQGLILTPQEIRALALDYAPHLKVNSILPAEHTETRSARCRICQQTPIFRRQSHGLFEVLPQTHATYHPTLHEILLMALQGAELQRLSLAEIRDRVKALALKVHLPSIIPTDHMAGGNCKACAGYPLFEKTETEGVYLVRDVSILQALTPALKQAPTHPETQLELKTLQLIKWVKHYGPQRLRTHSEQALTQLAQLFPPQEREGYLLRLTLKHLFVRDILEFATVTPWSALEGRLVQRLFERYGISLEFGRWAIRSWGRALQISDAQSLLPDDASKTALPIHTPVATYLGPERIQARECQLQWLEINHTATGYDALKRHHRSIAMVVHVAEQGYVLGIKRAQAKRVHPLLAAYSTPESDGCPVAYLSLFSPQRRTNRSFQDFEWFVHVPRSLVILAFQSLDQLFAQSR